MNDKEMSNILPEDVKLMAEFMGLKYFGTVREGQRDEKVLYKDTNCDRPSNDPVTAPDYPKDMNALLGVMDKLKSILPHFEWFPHHITGTTATTVVVKFFLLSDWVTMESEPITCYEGIPTVLFPLLVEAIKQIKESE